MKESAYFWGNGYIKLRIFSLGIQRNFYGEIVLAILFSTERSNGTILYWPVDNKKDFLIVSISNGFLQLTSQFFGSKNLIRNNITRVDDGFNHLLIIKKRDKKCVLELDHHMIYGEISIQKRIPFFSNYIYLGWFVELFSFKVHQKRLYFL